MPRADDGDATVTRAREVDMIRRILLPLDGSEFAESAVPRALRLLDMEKAEVVLVHAVPEVGISGKDLDVVRRERIEEAQRYLARVRDNLLTIGLSSRLRVEAGPEAEIILRASEQERVDLIAMSSHARSGLGRLMLGSVAERIRLHAKVPVLLIRPEGQAGWNRSETTEESYRRILVPLDGSRLAEDAIPYAKDVARLSKGKVILLQVVAPVYVRGMHADSLVKGLTDEAESYLEEVSARFELPGIARVELGTPPDTILSSIESEEVDLVVMTTHGLTGFQRFLMGSVADRVVRGSRRPVLLIRSPKSDDGVP
jgi:nucleotide-binding universal stress UspA family protein